MKKSTLFVGYKNYQIKSKKQYQKELKHILRLIETENIERARSLSNQCFFYKDGELVNTEDLSLQELYDLVNDQLQLTLKMYKEKNHNSQEIQEKNNQLIEQRRNTKKRLEGKDLSFEEFENSNLSAQDYINKFWTKQYKSENMTERMKKRTLESLEKYLQLKNEIQLKDKDLQISGYNTMFQEMVFKIPITNGVDFTLNEIHSIIEAKIKIEKEKGNEPLLTAIHMDESSIHPHILFINKDFKIVRNQQEYLLKKYNLDYDLEKLSKEELEHLGELQQQEDYQLINENMKQDIYFDLVHNINENISNEERKLSNKLINKKHSYTNIDNRRFNNINLEKENILKEEKELILNELKLIEVETKLKQKEQDISFNSSYKPSVSNDLSTSNQTYFKNNYFKKLELSLKNLINEFKGAVHNSIIEEIKSLKGRTKSKKLRDQEYLNNLAKRNQKRKSKSQNTFDRIISKLSEREIESQRQRVRNKINQHKQDNQQSVNDYNYSNGFTR